jgi:hypothetical protein
LVCPPSDAGRASIWRHVWVLPNQRHRPLPLLSLERRGPRVERAKWSAARRRPDMGVCPDVRTLALPYAITRPNWAKFTIFFTTLFSTFPGDNVWQGVQLARTSTLVVGLGFCLRAFSTHHRGLMPQPSRLLCSEVHVMVSGSLAAWRSLL